MLVGIRKVYPVCNVSELHKGELLSVRDVRYTSVLNMLTTDISENPAAKLMRRFGGAAAQSKGSKAQPPRWSSFGAWESLPARSFHPTHNDSLFINALGPEI